LQHIIQIKGRYYYNRRVPQHIREFDPRDSVRIALKTDSKQEALKLALILNSQIEAYWRGLIRTGKTHDEGRFKKAVHTAHLLGFTYRDTPQIASGSLEDIRDRVKASSALEQTEQLEAVLGGIDRQEIKLTALLDRYWVYSKDRILNKSEDQVRKWKNPRIKAVSNFIALVGDKPIHEITRDNVILFRDWWAARIDQDDLNATSANKDFIHLKSILETVSDNLVLGIDTGRLFKKIMFKKRFEQTRMPFTTQQILDLLNSDKLDKTDVENKWFLYAAAETGARPSELIGLLPQDIRLSAAIPHIAITDRKERPLKTAHSQREIPLVGYALEAFKNMPNGFPRYRDKPDNLTNSLNKFLRDHELLSSDKHSLYSLRHSFQDRILSVNAPDRVQAELMGHSFKRPKYGDGALLGQKKEWLDKVVLKDCKNGKN
jgi:integrase